MPLRPSSSDLVGALHGATTAAHVLKALAAAVWAKAHEGEACPPAMVSTLDALAVWLPDCGPDPLAHTYMRALPLNPTPRRPGQRPQSDYFRSNDWPGPFVSTFMTLAALASLGGRWRILPDGPWQGGGPTGMQFETSLSPAALAETVEWLHGAWLDRPDHARGKHPLGPLVAAWQARPERIDPDSRRSGILPLGLFNGQPHHAIIPGPRERPEAGMMMPGAILEADRQLTLPLGGTEASTTTTDIVRPAPLVLADGLGLPKRGRGARLDKRLLVHSLLSMPRSQRQPGGRYELVQTVRQLGNQFWSRWRPGAHGKALLAALESLYYARVRLPDGRLFVPAVTRYFPDPARLDSEAVIQLELPDDCGRGPLIGRKQLRLEGMVSDPAYDLWMGLAYLWDQAKARNGGNRIYAGRPKVRRARDGCVLDAHGRRVSRRNGSPIKDWTHARAVRIGLERHPQADTVPALDAGQLRALAFGDTGSRWPKQKRMRTLATAKQLIRGHEQAGRVVVETVGLGRGLRWRILEAWTDPAL